MVDIGNVIRDPAPRGTVPALTVTADGKRAVVWLYNNVIEVYDASSHAFLARPDAAAWAAVQVRG